MYDNDSLFAFFTDDPIIMYDRDGYTVMVDGYEYPDRFETSSEAQEFIDSLRCGDV